MLSWANRFNIFCFLDNNSYQGKHHQQEVLVGINLSEGLTIERAEDLNVLTAFQQSQWLFGHLNYELNLPLFGIQRNKPTTIGFPAGFFFRAGIVVRMSGTEVTIDADEPSRIFNEISSTRISTVAATEPVNFSAGLSRKGYLNVIEKLQDHIRRGDCYEINFCQEFYSRDVDIQPLELFKRLTSRSPSPFSCFYKINDKFLVSASPERFLMKKGRTLISQPIKGTIARNVNNTGEDERLKEELRASAKDQAENVMVVDMVRHDLARICETGSVKVEELFGIYSYPQVHQMISTIEGKLRDQLSFGEVIAATFPMGSMTGAPKHKVVQLIDEYERSSRNIFSGSVGYIDPNGDFDFNVVIRSLMYNASQRYLSYKVGSGITIYSDPEKEWEECMLKGKALRESSYRC